MNKFIKVSLITGVVFIITGMVLGLAGVSLGGVAMAGGVYNSWDGEEEFIHEDSFETAERIIVDLNYGTVMLEPYEGEQILVSAERVSSRYRCSLEAGLLRIEDVKNTENLFRKRNNNKRVIIKVPEEIEWESAKLSIGAGKMVLEEFKGREVEINVGAGEVYGENIRVLDKLELENGVGSITLEEIETDKLEINNGIGDVKADGRVDGDTMIKNGIGSVLLTLSGRKEDYNYNVNSGIGSVRVNGNSFGEQAASANLYHGAKKTFDIDCGIGRIDLYLE